MVKMTLVYGTNKKRPLSPRLQDRFKVYHLENGELKKTCRFLFLEDIIIYSALIVFNLFFDPIHNLLTNINLNNITHPIHFGFLQGMGLLFCVLQIIRKTKDWAEFAKVEDI